jgi:hypothetical protein
MIGADSWEWEFRRMVATSNTSEAFRAAASAVGSGNIRPARPTTANSTTASGSRRYLLRGVLCLTVGSSGLFGCGRPASAQTQVRPSGSAAVTDVDAAVVKPGPTSPSSDFAHLVDAAEEEGSTADPEFLPEVIPPDAWAGGEMGLLGMIRESMFGSYFRRPRISAKPSSASSAHLRAMQ